MDTAKIETTVKSKSRTFYFAFNIGILVLMIGFLAYLILCDVVIMGGEVLNISTFLPWVVEFVHILPTNLMQVVPKVVLGVFYPTLIVLSLIRIYRVSVNCINMLRKGADIDFCIKATVITYNAFSYIVLQSFGLLIGISFISESMLNQNIYLMFNVAIPLLLGLRFIINTVTPPFKDRAYCFSVFLETLFASVIALLIIYFIQTPAIHNIFRGFTVLFNGGVKWTWYIFFCWLANMAVMVVNPILIVIMAFSCRNVLVWASGGENPQNARWQMYYLFKKLLICALIALIISCVADAVQMYQADIYSDTFSIIKRFYVIGRSLYIPIIFLSVAGIIATRFDPPMRQEVIDTDKDVAKPCED